ncbi:hypothetical protein [Nocardioides sp.]|uniref:hypothetical protein n=1 Tax=Nocardioides sp. TaxID=35761 RepID=UPI0035630099
MHEVTEGTVHVETLTDEELKVLIGQAGVSVTPHLDALAPGQRAMAEEAAFRSLSARGVASRPDIRAVVTLREAARTRVSVVRTTGGRQSFWYGHVVDGVLLVEQVSQDGMHHFALADATRLGDLLVRAAVHDLAGDASGPGVTWANGPEGDGPPSVVERLGEPWIRADVTLCHPADPDPAPQVLFTGPGGCWWADTDWCAGAPVARPMTAVGLRSKLQQLAGPLRETPSFLMVH